MNLLWKMTNKIEFLGILFLYFSTTEPFTVINQIKMFQLNVSKLNLRFSQLLPILTKEYRDIYIMQDLIGYYYYQYYFVKIIITLIIKHYILQMLHVSRWTSKIIHPIGVNGMKFFIKLLLDYFFYCISYSKQVRT